MRVMRSSEEEIMINQAVANVLNEIIENIGVTVNALAAMSEMESTSLARILRGQARTVSLHRLRKVCRCLGMTLSEFFEMVEREYASLSDSSNKVIHQ